MTVTELKASLERKEREGKGNWQVEIFDSTLESYLTVTGIVNNLYTGGDEVPEGTVELTTD